MEWDEEQEEAAQKAIERQKLTPIPPEEQGGSEQDYLSGKTRDMG